MLSSIDRFFYDLPLVWAGSLASLIAGVAAGIGALPVLAVRRLSRPVHDSLLGFAGGVMLAASAFSLLLPALRVAGLRWESPIGGAVAVALGFVGGTIGLFALHHAVPHEHFVKGRDVEVGREIRRIFLLVLAITLHNFPEGLAVGVAFGGGEVTDGLAVTAGIFLQNLPEGLIVAVALIGTGYGRGKAIAIALGTGAVETLGGLVGAGAIAVAGAILPWGLAAAAGAMTFVVAHEVIPEAHRQGNETPATFGLVVGFAVMMILDVALA